MSQRVNEPAREALPLDAPGGIAESLSPAGAPAGSDSRSSRGFTLIELMVVVAILGILISMAVPTYRGMVLRARETVLRQNLFTIRDVIDQYYADKGKYPDSLEELVSAGYMRRVPVDPMTEKDDWVTVPFTGGEEGQLEPTEGDTTGGIFDVHSASEKESTSGSKYAEW